jgi:midasin (ATPase involved in ribosome maturation)
LVEALAAAGSTRFSRANLSEHTELADLVGGFVPSSEAGIFCFRGGPLLTAMRDGY